MTAGSDKGGEGTLIYELITHSLHHELKEGLKREQSYPLT